MPARLLWQGQLFVMPYVKNKADISNTVDYKTLASGTSEEGEW